MFIGYIDENMKNIGSELQREQIAAYATENNLCIDLYSKGTDIIDFKNNLKTQNHTIVFANVVSFGTTLKVICQNIRRLAESGNTIILAKENIKIIPEEWQEIVKGIELAIDIRSSLTSTITCKALSEVKASGKIWDVNLRIKNIFTRGAKKKSSRNWWQECQKHIWLKNSA